jgi:broad specificity phosphatase PhoE
VTKPSNDILFFTGRHGRTAANSKDIYRAWSNAPEAQLSDEGRQDADDMAQFFRRNYIPVQVIVTDDLERTQETAKRVAHILGVDEVLTSPRLRPLNMGDYTLKSKKEYPVDEFLKNPSKQIPGGESVNDFNSREVEVFSDVLRLARKTDDGFILVVCHGSNNSFLNNHVYSAGTKVGYEGLVNPGGVVMATDANLCPLTNVRKSDSTLPPQASKETLDDPDVKTAILTARIWDVPFPFRTFALPANHEPGMQVPKGGSSCASCEYLGKDKKTCTQKDFIAWNGSDVIPGKIDEYCSDWYHMNDKEKKRAEENPEGPRAIARPRKQSDSSE